MGLYKRNKIWWMAITYQGKQVRRSTEVSDKKLAEKIYFKVKTQIAEGKWFEKMPGEDRTFQEAIERYLSEHSARNKAPLTHLRDKSLSSHLLQSFGGLTLAEIRPHLISEYKGKRTAEGAAPKTINNELILMSHLFNLAMKEWEWVRENPVSKTSKERVNNLIERWLTSEEEEKLLAGSPKWLQEIILFAVNTGFRQGEILNLQWPLVDIFRKTVTILEQKNKSKDTLPLNQKALDVLKARIKARQPGKNDYVFFNRNGNRMDARNLQRAFHSAVEKAEIPKLRFHDLRHTFATRLVQAGVDLYTVQKLGRWKTISMVMRYAHHYPESLRPGVESLDRVRDQFITNLSQSNKKGLVPVQASP